MDRAKIVKRLRESRIESHDNGRKAGNEDAADLMENRLDRKTIERIVDAVDEDKVKDTFCELITEEVFGDHYLDGINEAAELESCSQSYLEGWFDGVAATIHKAWSNIKSDVLRPVTPSARTLRQVDDALSQLESALN